MLIVAPQSRLQDPGRRPDALRRLRPRRLAQRHARLQHCRAQVGTARPLHRMDAREAREEPPLVIDNPRFLNPALDHDPQPRLAHPVAGPPATAQGLDRALQHHAGAHRDLRRDPALHRRALQGVRLEPRRNHPGPRALRQAHQAGAAEERHLAPAPPKRLEANSEPMTSCPPITA